MGRLEVAVVGQLARDLVLRVDAVPEAGGSGVVRERIEALGGKGANQAVGMAQLGLSVALVGVAGDDGPGDAGLRRARSDGIDTTGVVRRGRTALMVDVVTADGTRRLLEDVPAESLLTSADVGGADGLLSASDTVCIQLQQPTPAVLEAAARARGHGALVVVDGAPEAGALAELTRLVDVVRADAVEAAAWTGSTVAEPVPDAGQALDLAGDLLARGPRLVCLAVAGGDLLAWKGGHRVLPHRDVQIIDPTGGGDAFVAGLAAGLSRGLSPVASGGLASAAAGLTVQRLGGRPDLASLRRDLAEGDARRAVAPPTGFEPVLPP